MMYVSISSPPGRDQSPAPVADDGGGTDVPANRRRLRLPRQMLRPLPGRRPPPVDVPEGGLLRRIPEDALDPALVNQEARPREERDLRDFGRHEGVGLIQDAVTPRIVDRRLSPPEQGRDAPVAVLHVVLVAAAAVDRLIGDGRRRATDPGEHEEVPVARPEDRAEDVRGRTECRANLDADSLELALDDLERELTELVAGRGREAERQLPDLRARVDAVGTLGAAVPGEQPLGRGAVERPAVPVRPVRRLERLEDHVLEHRQARSDRAVERVGDRRAVDAPDQRLTHVQPLERSVTLRATLDVDVLPRELRPGL